VVFFQEEYSYREDFRSELLFTIDPATARDLDDALHVKELPGGLYEVCIDRFIDLFSTVFDVSNEFLIGWRSYSRRGIFCETSNFARRFSSGSSHECLSGPQGIL